ncbi:hypothetical protein [Deinococcus yavapaiensis]|uniref:Uncharacterized protein n=1 Tax=Deinococcus yavapaiensis KR-236 TaxID=694435 RepID=A0A318S5F1_9DEIO|nr:hypothetical protein [Deinococcus yavapaiensis]PYE48664.1 hypothetical protein DES52_12824 [Deinococcus yavapaiensis KR-236]
MNATIRTTNSTARSSRPRRSLLTVLGSFFERFLAGPSHDAPALPTEEEIAAGRGGPWLHGGSPGLF